MKFLKNWIRSLIDERIELSIGWHSLVTQNELYQTINNLRDLKPEIEDRLSDIEIQLDELPDIEFELDDKIQYAFSDLLVEERLDDLEDAIKSLQSSVEPITEEITESVEGDTNA